MTKTPPYSSAITVKKSDLSLRNPCFFRYFGRKAEVKQVLESFESDKSELVSVYGRCRAGKTFLIKGCFNEEVDFWFTVLCLRIQRIIERCRSTFRKKERII